MRTLCDSCESGAAIVFCAADEAALCRDCDEKVHLCNKLASRHVRVGLASPSDVPRCDICENAPAFFYCDLDGSSLCLQCDISVHVGGKRTHGRYLLLRQRIEFPGDKSSLEENVPHNEQKLNAREMFDHDNRMDGEMFDLNMRPQRLHGQPSNNPGMEVGSTNPDLAPADGVEPSNVDPRN